MSQLDFGDLNERILHAGYDDIDCFPSTRDSSWSNSDIGWSILFEQCNIVHDEAKNNVFNIVSRFRDNLNKKSAAEQQVSLDPFDYFVVTSLGSRIKIAYLYKFFSYQLFMSACARHLYHGIDYNLYLVHYKDNIRVKIVEENFAELFAIIVKCSVDVWLYCLYDVKNGPPVKLTKDNLALLSDCPLPLKASASVDAESLSQTNYSSEEDDSGTKSAFEASEASDNSKISKMHEQMEDELLLRDNARCVACNKHAEMHVTYLFTEKEKRKLSLEQWMKMRKNLGIDHFYGPKNGFAMCVLCNKMMNNNLLSIKSIDVNGIVEYAIECSTGSMGDPLFAHVSHAVGIHGKFLRRPTDSVKLYHWPDRKAVDYRYKMDQAKLSTRNEVDSTYAYECFLCGKLYKRRSDFVKHYGIGSCLDTKNTRKRLYSYSHFGWVREADQSRKERSAQAIEEATLSAMEELSMKDK